MRTHRFPSIFARGGLGVTRWVTLRTRTTSTEDLRKATQRLLLVLALLLAALAPLSPAAAQMGEPMRDGVINLAHLRFLTEPVQWGDRHAAIVHIYAEYPEYEWVDAAGEGIAAVDDVARAAIVYLRYYERTGDTQSLDLARRCLEFVRSMQTADGEFYNFVLDREGTINTEGSTSYKSLGWWAMRGMWALAEGVRVFDTADPAYADELATSYLLTETALRDSISSVGEYSLLHGYRIPNWIPNGAPDVASVGLLALASYQRARPNDDTAALITDIADGVAAYHFGDSATYPFGMFPVTTNAPGYWHAWGSHMIAALADAGAVLDRQDWIEAAASGANTFLVRQLAFERIREIGVLPNRLGQIAYGTDMLVQDFMALYHATGETRYAQFAGLAASWFFGNNMAGVAMYDAETGRGYDGINGPFEWRVNRNAGAESTIEALLALLAVTAEPTASRYLMAQEVSVRPYERLEAEFGETIAGKPDLRQRDWTGEAYFSFGRYLSLGAGDVVRVTADIPETLDYWIYVALQRQGIAAEGTTLVAPRAAASPTIDGNLSEWVDVPLFSANTARQFLRGAGIWRGPEVDSFDVQFMWDDENLYLAATVRDPVHEQPEIGPSVWRYDALWGYLDATGQGKRLSSKFTLAQTPDGPQVWDWVASTWLPKAELAWQPFADGSGYIYEARLPFQSLRVRHVAAGQTLGVEIGRGIGGDSFLDLTGADPDVAANLAKLVLVDRVEDLASVVDSETALAGPQNAIALQIAVDGGSPIVVPANTSPDRRYLWLDRATVAPLHLDAGTHTLDLTYAGTEALRRVEVDGVLVQPVVARRVFATPEGVSVELVYDTLTGEVTLNELSPN